jgi:hypothetical protein
VLDLSFCLQRRGFAPVPLAIEKKSPNCETLRKFFFGTSEKWGAHPHMRGPKK